MLRPEGEATALMQEMCPRGPYVDPVFLHKPREYAVFLRRAAACGMVKYRRAGSERGMLGVFFVAKKPVNGMPAKLRLIMDTRLLNARFMPPSYTQLPTPAAWSAVRVPKDHPLVL